MQRTLIMQISVCLIALTAFLYINIEKQNKITALQIALPKVVKNLQSLQEEKSRLRYKIELFESPENLLRLAAKPEFQHLRHPLEKEVLALQETETPILVIAPSQEPKKLSSSAVPLATHSTSAP